MTAGEDPTVSAMVLLRPEPGGQESAGGRESAGGQEPAEPPPAPGGGAAPGGPDPAGGPAPGTPESTGGAAPGFFTQSGFDVGPVVGDSFSITGPRSLFERTFGEPLEAERRGRATSYRTARGTAELGLEQVPEPVAGHIEAITFSRPPDFGPTSFG